MTRYLSYILAACIALASIGYLSVHYVQLSLVEYVPHTKRYTQEDHVDSCHFHKYRDMVILDADNPLLPTNYLAKCHGVIYNRIPKAASRTMLRTFQNLSDERNFTVIYHDRGYIINQHEENLYRRSMQAVENNRFVLVSHHYYHNFTRLPPYPQIYINVIREPSSWFVSNYFFHRIYFKSSWNSQPIRNCITSSKCFNYVRSTWGAMRFICGLEGFCKRNNEVTLMVARRRLDKDYLLIGIYEQLHEFNEVLEYLMPNMFAGLLVSFNRTEAAGKLESQTKRKEPLSNETLHLLEANMKYEKSLYFHARQKFNQILAAVRKLKAEQNIVA